MATLRLGEPPSDEHVALVSFHIATAGAARGSLSVRLLGEHVELELSRVETASLAEMLAEAAGGRRPDARSPGGRA